jgi:hypothetical protein
MPNGGRGSISSPDVGPADVPGAPPKSLRLYVLDCGRITGIGAAEFGFKDGELAAAMFTPCFLIVHPREW